MLKPYLKKRLKKENPDHRVDVPRILHPKKPHLAMRQSLTQSETLEASTSQKLTSAMKTEKLKNTIKAWREDKMIRLGLDLGTKTIVLAKRNEDGKVAFKHEINGFFEFKNPDKFTKNLLTTQKIPQVQRGDSIYALGGKAEKLAYAFNSNLKRPMADGTVSDEKEAISIMASIIQAIIGKLEDDAVLYYCIPANAINKETNVEFHNKIARMVIESYKRSDSKITATPINEARALAIGSGEQITIAISWGAGMVNVCYSMFGVPVFEFSIVGSGDWIDVQSAMRFGFDPKDPSKHANESPTTICRRKEEIDLSVDVNTVDNVVDKTIMLHYQILIENVVNGIIDGFNKNIDKARIDQEIPIVMAGGTSSPNGFSEYFEKILRSKELPFEVSTITVQDRPLYSVAAGCLMAAELHGDD